MDYGNCCKILKNLSFILKVSTKVLNFKEVVKKVNLKLCSMLSLLNMYITQHNLHIFVKLRTENTVQKWLVKIHK